MRFFILAVVLSIAPAALAQPIYRWIDENGVTNYTNDQAKVPDGVKAETTEGAEITVVASSRAVPSQSAAAPVSLSTDLPTPEEEREVADYMYWRSAFRDLHSRVALLETVVGMDKQRLEAEGTPFRSQRGREYRASFDSGNLELQQRLEWNLAELQRTRAELDELERIASRVAVPREWRQP